MSYLEHVWTYVVLTATIILAIGIAWGIMQRRRPQDADKPLLPPDSPRAGGANPSDPDLRHQGQTT